MEEKKQLIARVRSWIGDAEVEKACDALLAFLEKNPAYLSLHNDVLQAQALYRRTRREESQGLINAEQARQRHAQVNDQLLHILNSLSREEIAGAGRHRTWPYFLLAALVVAGILYFTLGRRGGTASTALCPEPGYGMEFPFRVLLLPFRDYTAGGEANLEIPVSLRSYFENLKNKRTPPLGIDVRVMEAHAALVDDPNRFPPNFQQASDIAEPCRANLVVWGTQESQAQSHLIQTSYRFIGFGEDFAFHKVKFDGQSSLDTVSALSTIATEGVLTEGIEEAILLLCGIIAQKVNDPDAAITWMNKVATTDSATVLTREMFLAEGYLSKQQYDSAAAAYDRILAVHEDYGFALENRANLFMFNRQFPQAIDLLDRRLQAAPANAPELLRQRGLAKLRSGDARGALQDFNRAKQDRQVDQLLQRFIREAETLVRE